MASIAAKNESDMNELTELFKQTKITNAFDYIKDERKRKVAVMNFGRLNPPTRGHYKLLEYIAGRAKLLGGTGFIFLSASQNYLPPHKGTKWRPVVNRVTKSTFRSNKSNENPLSVWDKMNILHKFPKIENLEYINPQGEKGRPYSMVRAADFLRDRGYTDIYLVVGTDRFEQLKDKGVESEWNLTLIEHPRSERLEDLTLYSIDKTIPKKSLEIKPEAISGTQARAAAAEHAINGINGIDSMTLRQAKEAIMNRKKRMYQSHGFTSFKEYMPNILTDSQLEFIIYKIKKGMLLRPSESYTNHHKINRMVKRSSITNTTKNGGKRRKKKTRKKRGGMERINVEGMWVDITLNDIKVGETYRVTTTSYRGVIPSPFIGTYKDVIQNSSMQNIFRFSIQPIHAGLRGTGPLDFTFPEGTIQRVEQYNIAPNGNRDLGREIKSFVGGRRKKTRKKRGKGAIQSYFAREQPQRDYTWNVEQFDGDYDDFGAAQHILELFMRDDGYTPEQEEEHRRVYQRSIIDDYHNSDRRLWQTLLQWSRLETRVEQQLQQQRWPPGGPPDPPAARRRRRRASVASTSLAPPRLTRQGGKRRRKKKTRKKRKRKGRKSRRKKR